MKEEVLTTSTLSKSSVWIYCCSEKSNAWDDRRRAGGQQIPDGENMLICANILLPHWVEKKHSRKGLRKGGSRRIASDWATR